MDRYQEYLEMMNLNQNYTINELQSSYKKMIEKYSLNKYEGNELKELAEEKLKKIDEAYIFLFERAKNNKANGKKYIKILVIVLIVVLIGTLIFSMKNKISKEKTPIVDTEMSSPIENNIEINKLEDVITDINDENKLFRTTLGEGTYTYVPSYSNENTIDREIKMDLDNDNKEDQITFGDLGDGIYFYYYNPAKDIIQSLLDNEGTKNPETANYYFENGWIRKDVNYQITVLDLDNDGIKEIIFSAYDTVDFGLALHSYIWKGDNEQYKYVGEIEGQVYMYFDERTQSIIVPIGSQGLFSEYKVENGKIVEISQK